MKGTIECGENRRDRRKVYTVLNNFLKKHLLESGSHFAFDIERPITRYFGFGDEAFTSTGEIIVTLRTYVKTRRRRRA